MANLQSNPWSFTSTDPATAAISTSITLNADGTVTVVSAALTFNTSVYTSEVGVEPPLGFTVTGVTLTAYNGFYYLISGTSGGTTFVLKPQFPIASGTAASSGGTIAQCLYRQYVRIEDISWQATSTATGVTSGALLLTDRSGNTIWQSAIGSTGTFGQLNRGKVFWVNGFTPITIPTNSIVLVTVD
jgi:hypothetical protein